MSTTAERIYRQLQSSHRGEINALAGTLDIDDQTFTLTYDFNQSIRVGTVLTIGYERMRVMGFVDTSKTVTVIRGWMDSDAATHAAGDIAWLDSRFSPFDVLEAMRSELAGWGPQLYRVLYTDFTISDGAETSILPDSWANIYGIIGAWAKPDGGFVSGDDVTSTSWPTIGTRLVRGGLGFPGATTSGLLLRYVPYGGYTTSGAIRVKAAIAFDPDFATDDDLLTDAGLTAGQVDVLEMGVKVRLLMDGQNSRTARDVQDEPRRAEENPVGSAVQPNQAVYAMYRYRKQEEINKLVAQNPIRVEA